MVARLQEGLANARAHSEHEVSAFQIRANADRDMLHAAVYDRRLVQ